MTLTFTFPLPPLILSPNSRSHFHAKGRATKQYRTSAKVLVMTQVAGGFKPRYQRAAVQVKWIAKTRRFPDGDNALATLKSLFDGLTDAGIFSDDRGLTHHPVEFAVDKENPRLVLTISAV